MGTAKTVNTMAPRQNAELVTDFLKANKGMYFCHDCVALGTGVTPTQQVNQIIRPLEYAKEFRYMRTTCSECSRDRKCVGFFE